MDDTTTTTTTGTQLMLEGIDQVSDSNEGWMDSVLELFDTFTPDVFAADDFRDCVADAGIGQPKHPNAWGAVFSILRRKKKIKLLGYRPHRHASAHSRQVSVWEQLKQR